LALLTALQTTDINLFYLINIGIKNPIFDFFSILISDTVYAFIFIAMYALFKHDKKVLMRIVLAIVFLSILVFAIKYGIDQQRPYEVLEGVILLKYMGTQPSFPSGHTTLAFGFWAILTENRNILKLKNNLKRIIPSLILVWAFLVAFSRIYVGVHYPHDVIGGMIIGIIFGYAFFKRSEKIIK